MNKLTQHERDVIFCQGMIKHAKQQLEHYDVFDMESNVITQHFIVDLKKYLNKQYKIVR